MQVPSWCPASSGHHEGFCKSLSRKSGAEWGSQIVNARRSQFNTQCCAQTIMERYQVSTHKESGIVNDPNHWCDEHNTPHYIIDLIKRLVTLSLEPIRINNSLPDLKL